MAVISCKPAVEEGCLAIKGSFAKEEFTFDVEYVVICDSKDDDPASIYFDVLTPSYGYTYSFFTTGMLAKCVDVSIDPRGGGGDDKYAWTLTAKFSTKKEVEEDPLDRPLEISWDRAEYDRVADKDIFGVPILTSAGQPFDPPITVDDSRPVLKIVRNEGYFDPAWADLYSHAINIDWFLGGAPYTWVCTGITAQRAEENGQYYWPVNYQFQYRRDNWWKKPLSIGRYERTSEEASSSGVANMFGKKLKPILDTAGHLISDPVPLNAYGKRAKTPEEAHYGEWRVHKEVYYSAFGFVF